MAIADKDRVGWLIFGVVGILVVAVFGAYAWKKISRPIVGPDNCVYEDKQLLRRKHTDHTVIMVDQSEALSESHKRQVKQLLIDHLADDATVPVDSAVMLYVFGKNDFQKSGVGQKLAPIAWLCKPRSTGNEVVENRRKIARQFYQKFVVPMYGAIEESLDVALGVRSPILEMFQYISRTQDIKEVPGSSNKKTLVVISDLLQHSDPFTHYKPWTYEAFQSSGSASLLRMDLRGWDIKLLYLQRYGKDQALQGSVHFAFWQRIIHESGGRIVTAEKIP